MQFLTQGFKAFKPIHVGQLLKKQIHSSSHFTSHNASKSPKEDIFQSQPTFGVKPKTSSTAKEKRPSKALTLAEILLIKTKSIPILSQVNMLGLTTPSELIDKLNEFVQLKKSCPPSEVMYFQSLKNQIETLPDGFEDKCKQRFSADISPNRVLAQFNLEKEIIFKQLGLEPEEKQAFTTPIIPSSSMPPAFRNSHSTPFRSNTYSGDKTSKWAATPPMPGPITDYNYQQVNLNAFGQPISPSSDLPGFFSPDGSNRSQLSRTPTLQKTDFVPQQLSRTPTLQNTDFVPQQLSRTPTLPKATPTIASFFDFPPFLSPSLKSNIPENPSFSPLPQLERNDRIETLSPFPAFDSPASGSFIPYATGDHVHTEVLGVSQVAHNFDPTASSFINETIFNAEPNLLLTDYIKSVINDFIKPDLKPGQINALKKLISKVATVNAERSSKNHKSDEFHRAYNLFSKEVIQYTQAEAKRLNSDPSYINAKVKSISTHLEGLFSKPAGKPPSMTSPTTFSNTFGHQQLSLSELPNRLSPFYQELASNPIPTPHPEAPYFIETFDSRIQAKPDGDPFHTMEPAVSTQASIPTNPDPYHLLSEEIRQTISNFTQPKLDRGPLKNYKNEILKAAITYAESISTDHESKAFEIAYSAFSEQVILFTQKKAEYVSNLSHKFKTANDRFEFRRSKNNSISNHLSSFLQEPPSRAHQEKEAVLYPAANFPTYSGKPINTEEISASYTLAPNSKSDTYPLLNEGGVHQAIIDYTQINVASKTIESLLNKIFEAAKTYAERFSKDPETLEFQNAYKLFSKQVIEDTQAQLKNIDSKRFTESKYHTIFVMRKVKNIYGFLNEKSSQSCGDILPGGVDFHFLKADTDEIPYIVIPNTSPDMTEADVGASQHSGITPTREIGKLTLSSPLLSPSNAGSVGKGTPTKRKRGASPQSKSDKSKKPSGNARTLSSQDLGDLYDLANSRARVEKHFVRRASHTLIDDMGLEKLNLAESDSGEMLPKNIGNEQIIKELKRIKEVSQPPVNLSEEVALETIIQKMSSTSPSSKKQKAPTRGTKNQKQPAERTLPKQ